MAQDYIERRGSGYYFIGSRVSLDSVVYQFLQGESPEGIAHAFPSLSLVQVYGGIAYYLEGREEIDAHLKAGEARFEETAKASREANPLLYARLDAAVGGGIGSLRSAFKLTRIATRRLLSGCCGVSRHSIFRSQGQQDFSDCPIGMYSRLRRARGES
jgi:uncharacterized protein (DUF433 family)